MRKRGGVFGCVLIVEQWRGDEQLEDRTTRKITDILDVTIVEEVRTT